MTGAYYGHVADIENESVEKMLHDIQVAVHNSIDEVEWRLPYPDSVFVALEDKLLLNPNTVFGFGAAFEPDYFPQKGRWFEPYAMWRDGKINVRQIGSVSHDYFEMEWYRKGVEADSGGYWSDPYFSDTETGMLFCTYSVPIRDSKGRKVGAFGGDLSLDILHEYLKKKDRKANTEGVINVTQEYEGNKQQWVYSIIVGRQGDYISHPEKERILHDNLFEALKQTPDTVNDRMMGDMKAGRKGSAKTRIDGVPVTVFYTPLEHTGWSLAVVLPDKRLNTVVLRFSIYLSSMLLLGLLAVYVICRITIRRATRPLHYLAKSADEVARGNFNAPLPDIRHNDEIHQLRESFGNMQQSLSQYMDELQTTTAQKSAIESELAIARNIQMAMLPKAGKEPLGQGTLARQELSTVEICASQTPAKAVGGDLYDYFVNGNRLYLCIGDVSGKGIPAALIMAMARSAFRLLAESETEPERIVSRMNDTMARENEFNFFITFFVGVLDLDTGCLRYCNAGHKAPYIMREDGGVSSEDQPATLPVDRNLPVGAMPDWKFTAQETILPPGTTLFLYTDGLTEAEDAQCRQFGVVRMTEVLRMQATLSFLVSSMIQAVQAFVGDTVQSDDLTMLALRYLGGQDNRPPSYI